MLCFSGKSVTLQKLGGPPPLWTDPHFQEVSPQRVTGIPYGAGSCAERRLDGGLLDRGAWKGPLSPPILPSLKGPKAGHQPSPAHSDHMKSTGLPAVKMLCVPQGAPLTPALGAR